MRTSKEKIYISDVDPAEASIMKDWLLSKKILLEASSVYHDRSIQFKLVDTVNNCCLASAIYTLPSVSSGNIIDLQNLVYRFEREEVHPILFHLKEVKFEQDMDRLIREN
jgi:hypothetical protein